MFVEMNIHVPVLYFRQVPETRGVSGQHTEVAYRYSVTMIRILQQNIKLKASMKELKFAGTVIIGHAF
jgi:hypothetical protein